MADKEETEKTIAEDLVVTKYKMAGEIVNRKKTAARVRAGDRAAANARVPSPSRPYGMRLANAGGGAVDHVPDPVSTASHVRNDATLPRIGVLLAVCDNFSFRGSDP